MTRLSWNQDLYPKFEFGVDHGVLYPESGIAVPWNGLINVTESPINDGTSSYYFDGVKYLSTRVFSGYQMTLTTVSAPQGFDSALGNVAVSPGFSLTKQQKSKFGMSYRTKIGDNLGFKIHLVYNAVVKSSNIVYLTIDNTGNIKTRSWTIDTTPLDYDRLRPSSHIIFDSTKMLSGTLKYLDTLLYGDETRMPRLPTMFELTNIFESWKPCSIDYEDDGFSPLIQKIEDGDLTALKIDGLLAPIHTTRLGLTSNPGFYRLES